VTLEAEVLRGLRREQQAFDGPGLAGRRPAAHLRRREHVDDRIVRRVDRDQMADPLARELGDHEAMARQHRGDLLAVGFVFRSVAKVDQAVVEDRHLQPEEAQPGGPSGDRFQGVEGRSFAQELSEEDGRALDRAHGFAPLYGTACRLRSRAKL
jgi:hypothetical protein